MTPKDISTIRRFMGAVEGVAESLCEGAKCLLYDYMAVVDDILDREESNNAEA